jgi:hypothetical protein
MLVNIASDAEAMAVNEAKPYKGVRKERGSQES